jgi:hypothetical protein
MLMMTAPEKCTLSKQWRGPKLTQGSGGSEENRGTYTHTLLSCGIVS